MSACPDTLGASRRIDRDNSVEYRRAGQPRSSTARRLSGPGMKVTRRFPALPAKLMPLGGVASKKTSTFNFHRLPSWMQNAPVRLYGVLSYSVVHGLEKP